MTSSVMAVACVSLLAVQLSGLHMHVDAHGYAGTPQGTHVHNPSAHSHGDEGHLDNGTIHGHEHGGDQGHDGDKDVSVIELNAGGSKLVMVGVWLGLSVLIPLTPGKKISPHYVVPRPVGRHARWRPPLRAPPRFS